MDTTKVNSHQNEIQPLERLKIDTEPRHLLVVGEPYVVLTYYGYTPAIKVYEKKKRRCYELLIGAKTLSHAIAEIVESNNEQFSGLDFWIWREHDGKLAKYIIEE